MFALNPAMPNLHRLYKAGAATIVHASATPYRERSHFDGQDVLESGLPRPGAVSTGWLNRALATLAPAERANPRARNAFAVGPIAPLVVRGAAPVLSWTPPRLPPAGDDTVMRLLDLYRHTDPALARVLEERMGLAAIARAGGMNQQGAANAQPRGAANAVRAYFEQSAGAAARFLARADGPRIGALAFDGWDTHANEGALDGRLAALLGALDGAIAAIETNMGEAWRETVVAVITEFGRTARINGTEGTDHGTGTVAILAGGALKGGRVVADWPGLARQRPAREARSQSHHRPARGAQGLAARSRARRRSGAGVARIPRQRGGEADGGAAGVTCCRSPDEVVGWAKARSAVPTRTSRQAQSKTWARFALPTLRPNCTLRRTRVIVVTFCPAIHLAPRKRAHFSQDIPVLGPR